MRRVGLLCALVLVASLVGPGGAGAVPADPSPPPAFSLPPGVARIVGSSPLRVAASASGRATSADAVIEPGGMAVADPEHDSTAGIDITDLRVASTPTATRFAIDSASSAPPWYDEVLVWWLDRDGDGVSDRAVFAQQHYSGRMIGGVTTLGPTARVLCSGSAGPDRLSVTVPTGCLGAIPALRVKVQVLVIEGDRETLADEAPETSMLGPLVQGTAAPTALGGIVMDPDGAYDWFSIDRRRAEPVVFSQPSDQLPDYPRAFAIGPDGGTGYASDGYGDVVPFAIGENFGGASPTGFPAFDFDILRGLTLTPNGRAGFALDGFGGLHRFGVGGKVASQAVLGAPYWPGWDIARGVAVLPDGRSGLVLDGFGGLHHFSLGTSRPAPRVIGAPYWRGVDVARGVVLLPDGSGGFIVDLFGGMHFFSLGTRRTQPRVFDLPYTAGTPSVAAITLVRSLPALPSPAPVPGVRIDGATSLALTIDGSTAYVTNPSGVAEVDVASETVTRRLSAGSGPSGVALSPDGDRLAIANTTSKDLSILDRSSGAELGRIPLADLGGSAAVAYGAGDIVYVADGVAAHLWRVDAAAGTVTLLDPAAVGYTAPAMVTIRASGDGARLVVGWISPFLTGSVGARLVDVASGALGPGVSKPWTGLSLPIAVGVDQSGHRIAVGPTGSVYDGNLERVAPAPMGVPLIVDAWGVHVLSVYQQSVRIDDIAMGGTRLLHLFDYVRGAGEIDTGQLAVSVDLHTIAVVTRSGVEFVHP